LHFQGVSPWAFAIKTTLKTFTTLQIAFGIKFRSFRKHSKFK
jgi:hypothetical protein